MPGAISPLPASQRRKRSHSIRILAADSHEHHPAPQHHNNGDDDRYDMANFYASYTKGLQHDDNGEVIPGSYQSLLTALQSGSPADFEEIILGMPSANSVRLTDPQAGLAYDLEGVDAQQFTLAPCYEFRSAGAIGEIAENYWLAICRDVPFNSYSNEPRTQAAITDLNRYAVFEGPKDNTGNVTPQTLFRATTKGALMGPYLSQFMILPIPYGSQKTSAQIAFGYDNTTNYMITEADWLFVQRGGNPGNAPQPLPNPRLIHNGRNLANYVHIDELFQAYLNACLLLITPQTRGGFTPSANPKQLFADENPYKNSMTQTGFGTLGEPNFKTIVAEVATRALKAVWFQKWFVHRRLRPETYAGRIHFHLAGTRSYDFDAVEFAKLQTGPLAHPDIAGHYFLPMAFPEGSPTHPAYGAGHATVAGACVSVLKALFKTETKLMDIGITPQEPTADGSGLQPYAGADINDLTIGGELDKLAANVGIARNFAGVHWRSDYTASARLGEEVARRFLQDYVQTYNEDIAFTWIRFDGTTEHVEKH